MTVTDLGLDATRQVQLLYELALAIGRTLEVEPACEEFINVLLSRKALAYAGVWARGEAIGKANSPDHHLLFALPRARLRHTLRTRNHPLPRALDESPHLLIGLDSPLREALGTDLDLGNGQLAVFRLREIGWIEMLSTDPQAFAGSQMAMLRSVITKFATALEGALAHRRLKVEVAERSRAESRLFEALAEREAIVRAIPDLLFTADAHGRVLWRNTSAGDTADGEITGQLLAGLVLPSDQARVATWLAETLALGRSEIDVRIPQQGSERRFHLTGVRVNSANREAFAIVGSARDVTERERAAEERRDLERRMQQAQKLESLGVLAGGIAHDFNNLLVPIMAHADLGRTHPAARDNEALRKSMEAITRAATRAADLARQMLAYSGHARVTVAHLDLGRLVAEIALLLEVAISKKVSLRRELDVHTPSIEGDEAQLRQIIVNLMTNASEAVGDQRGSITLRTGSVVISDIPPAFLVEGELAAGTYAFVEVTDSGVGMDANTCARIFDPFFSTKFTGRGLGLASVLGMVRTHRGGIAVRSAPGQGSTFRIFLPAAAAAADTAIADPDSSHTQLRGTVLVVDDEPLVRTTSRQVLESTGLKILEASDGQEAVDLVAAGVQMDAIVLDLTMPRLSGEEAARAIRLLRPTLPIILTSGFDRIEIADRITDERIVFLQKPFRVKELIDRVTEAVRANARP